MNALDQLKYNDQGLIPAVAQDLETGEILMLAWMNRDSLEKTLETGLATYWSRSRSQFWVKGETSGHTQRVHSISVDCDADAIVLKITQVGAACHENYRSCFFRDIAEGELVLNGVPKLND